MTADDLPTGGPTEPVNPDFETEEQALAHITGVLDNWILMEQLQGTEPRVAAAKLVEVLVQVLQAAMGNGAVRWALLVCLEKTFENGANFSDRQSILELLTGIAQARRKVEGKSGLIIPQSGDHAAD